MNGEVRLRTNFYGLSIRKYSYQNLGVHISFQYKGPAQTLEVEYNSGKKGLWGDYDQESPAWHRSVVVPASGTFKPYTTNNIIPLSFWGTRKIDDCAVEVVIRGQGVYDDAVLWDAYTINL